MTRFRSLTLATAAVACALLGALALSSVPALAAAEGCPNEQVRAESKIDPATGAPFSTQLPECRAYEMVSPPSKDGAPITSGIAIAGSSKGGVARIGSEGSTVLINSTGIWPGGEQPANNNLYDSGSEEGVQYRVTRGESGWEFKPEEPPELRDFRGSLLPSPADLGSATSTDGIWGGIGTAPTEAALSAAGPSRYPNFYLLEAGGALAEVGPSVPLSDRQSEVIKDAGTGEVRAAGGSADLSHMLFNLPDLRWPFDQSKLSTAPGESEEVSSLYEYVGSGHSGEGGDVPTLVGVDNTGTLISTCGTEVGGYGGANANERVDETGEVEARSISAAGSSVFFTARATESYCDGGAGPAVNEVFARVGEPGPGTAVGSAVTVNVAGTGTTCEASDSCDVTKAVKYQGASTDGSKVLFTSEQPLVAGDADATNNLYECRLPGDAGAPLTRMTPVDPCPELVRVSIPTVAGAGAEVQSVAAVSQDGSHVYFVAKGILTAEPDSSLPSGHQVAEQGQDNLYVWEEPTTADPQGRTKFIATLSAPAFKLGEAQATPDGDSLVFTSSADLAPGDTSTVSQIFLYEASSEALRWVSEGHGGSEGGDTTTDPASIRPEGLVLETARSAEGRRVISEDGSVVVFQSSAALTPQVHGGTRNVYLWRGGDIYLISDGTPVGTAGSAAGGFELRGVAGLVGIDASGQNVFFTTEAALVAQDTDELSDLYDARVDGGFPAPKLDECAGEACQGASSAAPAPVTLGGLSPNAQGDLTAPPTMKSTAVPKPKPLTRAEELAKALKACTKDRAEKQRARCEATARKRYGATTKPKGKVKSGSKTKRTSGKSAGK